MQAPPDPPHGARPRPARRTASPGLHSRPREHRAGRRCPGGTAERRRPRGGELPATPPPSARERALPRGRSPRANTTHLCCAVGPLLPAPTPCPGPARSSRPAHVCPHRRLLRGASLSETAAARGVPGAAERYWRRTRCHTAGGRQLRAARTGNGNGLYGVFRNV